MGKGWIRLAGIAGILFVVLVAIPGFASGSPPDPADPASKYLSYYQDHRSAIIAGTFIAAAANFFVVFFIGGLLSALRRLGGSALLLIAALTALILTGGIALLGGILTTLAAFRVGEAHHVDAETIRLLADGSSICFTLLGFTIAAWLAATGMLMSATRLFPTWLSWVAAVGAVLELVGTVALFSTTGAFSPGGPAGLLFGLLPFAVFTVGTSIVMVMRGDAMEGAGA
jgi:hypothetical protein